jgi:hypothetical protein
LSAGIVVDPIAPLILFDSVRFLKNISKVDQSPPQRPLGKSLPEANVGAPAKRQAGRNHKRE